MIRKRIKKKDVVFVLILLSLLIGCNKWEDENIHDSNQNTGEVIFTGQSTELLLKDEKDTDNYAEYALFTIDGTEYSREIYYINNVPYTQSIKLSPGEYTVEQFLTYDDNQTPNDISDDILIYAIPEIGSPYETYVTQTVPFDIMVVAFQKLEYQVEVLYFEPSEWDNFGFDWFEIDQSTIREQCFFGDLCVENPDDYLGSLYENQENGPQVDMPAIAKIEVWQNSEKNPDTGFVITGSFDNEAWFAEGQPLCVNYEDYDFYEDHFAFKLFVLVAADNGFEYVQIHTWEFSDDELLESGDDGITDYVIGNCVPDADFIFPPYSPGSGTETAYAYTDGNTIPGDCFIDLGISTNWGWQIGPFETDYTFDIYAAAGQCNLNNGTLVGELVVDFKSNNLIDVTYNMDQGYTLEEVQLWFDDTSWSGNNVAPGQFPHKAENLGGVTSHAFTDLNYNGGDIYLIAHAVVIGF